MLVVWVLGIGYWVLGIGKWVKRKKSNKHLTREVILKKLNLLVTFLLAFVFNYMPRLPFQSSI